mgnify:CR=1 FL=1
MEAGLWLSLALFLGDHLSPAPAGKHSFCWFLEEAVLLLFSGKPSSKLGLQGSNDYPMMLPGLGLLKA